MSYKLAFTCTSCNNKLQIQVNDTMYSKRVSVRCKYCNSISTVNIPEEEVFTKKQKNTQSNNIADDKTFINQDIKKESYLKITSKRSEFTPIQSFDIDQERLIIGRKNSAGPNKRPDIEIVTNDTFMSKKHAVFMKKGSNNFVVSDLGSANGTWVNGERLEESDEVFIEEGDELKLGRTQFLVTQIK